MAISSQDKKFLIGGGIGVAVLAYLTRRRAPEEGFGRVEHERPERRERENDRGEYGHEKHKHKGHGHGD